jgi:glycerate kinase
MRRRTIILAPDSFKETLSAAAAARAMAAGVVRASGDLTSDHCPIGDGGEGTMDALVSAMGGAFETREVTGPLGQRMTARLARAGPGAIGIVEMAEASGLALVPTAARDPMRTTSYGTGELIAAAVERGCREIIVCIGGSATVDGGCGIAQACGVRFVDHAGNEITERMCGGLLARIAAVTRPDRRLPRIRVACDVTNPLCGERGAAAVYGPQKGATADQVTALERNLAHLARVAGGDSSKPGAGAAGGAGYGLMAFLDATLEPGINLVLDAVGFRERCRQAGLVITGEGRLDQQSLEGKACIGVAKAANELGVPAIAIVGSTGPRADHCVGPGLLDSYCSLSERFGHERSMHETPALLTSVTEEVVRRFTA